MFDAVVLVPDLSRASRYDSTPFVLPGDQKQDVESLVASSSLVDNVRELVQVPYVDAAQALGACGSRIILKHLAKYGGRVVRCQPGPSQPGLFSQGGANTTSQGGYHNYEVDRLVTAGRQERDYTKRFAIYEQLQELAARDVPVVALCHERAPYAYKSRLAGLRQRANFQPTPDEVRWS